VFVNGVSFRGINLVHHRVAAGESKEEEKHGGRKPQGSQPSSKYIDPDTRIATCNSINFEVALELRKYQFLDS